MENNNPPDQPRIIQDIVFSTGKDGGIDYCKALSASSVGFDETDCITAMTAIINNCTFIESGLSISNSMSSGLTNMGLLGDPGQESNKHGGRISINCMVYSIIPFPEGDDYPCHDLGVPYCRFGWGKC